MKSFLPVILVVPALLSACASPAKTGLPIPMKTNPSIQTTFHAPTVIQAPTIANDSPGQLWNYPADPAHVIQDIYKWISVATITTVQIPQENRNLIFHAYFGPSELYFRDQKGQSITVEPAYYITRANRGYHSVFIKNVIAYKNGKSTLYLKSPRLFNWLRGDKNWESEFRPEAWTDADKVAVRRAKASVWGGHFTTMFPAIPGVVTQKIQPGGPALSNAQKIGALTVTVASLVDEQGPNHKVTFIEVWNNGKGQHRWIYVVSPNGTVIGHTQSGDVPPQYRQ